MVEYDSPDLSPLFIFYFRLQKICLVDNVRVKVPLEAKTGATNRAQVKVAAKAKGVSN